jgi:hypothetical protein
VCPAKVAAQFAGRLRAGSSPARFDVTGAIRQPGEFDRSSGVSQGNGHADLDDSRRAGVNLASLASSGPGND